MGDPIVAAMQDVAGPHLYRRNAFRITGLPTGADRRAVRHQRQRISTLLQVGGETGLDAGPQEIAAAFDLILGDPRRRLVHELFWMWDRADAGCSCTPALHGAHDAAVRAHSKALDAELAGQGADELWTRAGDLWSRQARRAAFWDHLRERVVALDDRQLGEPAVGTLRDELPVTLVRPLVQLTVAGGARQAELSRLAHAWPGTSTFVETQLEKAAEPLYAELRAELRETSALLAGTLPPHGAEKRLRTRAVPKLERLEALVPAARHRETGRCRNDLATALNNCAAKLIDSSGAAAETTADGWLRRARELADEPQTIATIDKNAATLALIVRAERAGAVLQRPAHHPYPQPYPYVPARPRFAGARRLLKLIAWALLLYGIYWVIFVWDLGSSGSPVPTVSVTAERIAGNAAVGTCLAEDEDWMANAGALRSVPCEEEHWGEVLGYLPLGSQSPRPADELLSQRSLYECAFLQAQRGVAAGEYLTDALYTSAANWNRGDNYATCLLRRGDNEPMPSHAVADPRHTAPPDLTLTRTMMALDVAANPPPGSCIATRSSYDSNDGRADFIDCDQPHWGEIIGYPMLYEAGGTWPGDQDVRATAEVRCRAVHQERDPGKGYDHVVTWPGQEFWIEGWNIRKYAVCVARRTDDQLFTGALR